MQKKIQQLARGKFSYAKSSIRFAPEELSIEVLEGKDEIGEFVMTSTNHVAVRGIVCSSDPRMECLTPQFEGEEVRIRYQYHSSGCAEGDSRKGEFSIICDQGEYSLPFVVSVCKVYVDSSIGKIRNLDDFTRLARENFSEACQVFFGKNFSSVIGDGQVREQLLYEGLRHGSGREQLLYEGLRHGGGREQKVEEFLAAIHKKKPMDIVLEKTESSFYDIRESLRETLEIRKSQWGYVDIKVTSDADFLVPWKIQLTGEDFLGSVCPFEYYIRAEALHAGKNFGRLLFEIPGRKLAFTVCASRSREKELPESGRFSGVSVSGGSAVAEEPLSIKSVHREEAEGRVKLLQLYMDYRLKKIVTGVWSAGTVEILDHLMAMRPEHTLYPLMKAQALLVNRQRQEADWILRDFKRSWMDRTSPEWGYYLYLCTLMEREPGYVDRMAAEIEEIFHRHSDSDLLFLILLFVKEEYCQSGAKRLRALRQWMSKGKHSPYFYLEAYDQICQEPYLLGRLEGFEVEVLHWAAKQQAITKDVALVVMNAVKEKRGFDRFVYRILSECYRVNPRDELLGVICGYLIKGQRFGTEYHFWYELGIEHEIRITSLYEAYLMSLDGRQVGSVPRMIQLYFHYNSSISYQQKAILFANMIAEKNTQPEVYQKYRRTMEQFAMEQIEAGHINDDLAMVYDEMLRKGILNEELAHPLAKLLFTHKLVCGEAQIVRAVIWQKELAQPQIVPIVNGIAYFQVYTDEYCVILENGRGNCFTDSIFWHEQALLYPEAYMEKCLELASEEVPYLLYHFQRKQSWRDFAEQDEKLFELLLESDEIKESYKDRLLSDILAYYREKGEQEAIGKYLARLEPEVLQNREKKFVMELLIEARMYEKAYRAVQVFGYDELENTLRVVLCDYAIHACDFAEDEFLLGFAADTFFKGKYNDVLLLYLCRFYQGSVETMGKLWQAAEGVQIDASELEERILSQMLYTGQFVDGFEEIYESYAVGGGSSSSRDVCMAYLSVMADRYFREDVRVPAHVFVQLQELFYKGKMPNDVCKLGLLKYFASCRQLSTRQYEAADVLLAEFTTEKIYFGFYRRFDRKLMTKYFLQDQFFVEYHTRPGRRVQLHFSTGRIGGREEEMVEMYDGVYVKAFLLFRGDEVQYYITEEDGADTKATESRVLCWEATEATTGRDRYGCLNHLLAVAEDASLQSVQRNGVMAYYETQKKAEELFEIL